MLSSHKDLTTRRPFCSHATIYGTCCPCLDVLHKWHDKLHVLLEVLLLLELSKDEAVLSWEGVGLL